MKYEFEIVSLKGLKFKSELNNIVCELNDHYAFYNKEKGYLSFKNANIKEHGVKTPYANSKKVLQSILDDGGLVHYDNIEWLSPINNK